MANSINTNSTTFGASIVSTPSEQTSMQPRATLDSPALTPAASHEDFHEKQLPPHSPFYQHPPASHERLPNTQNPTSDADASKTHLAVFEKDLESATITPYSTRGGNDDNPFTSKVSVDANKECTMWPSRQTLMQKHLAEKRQKREMRRCGCGPARHKWAQYTKKQKLCIQIALAMLLVGVIVAIGVGVSKAVDGGVYAGNGKSHEIGETS